MRKFGVMLAAISIAMLSAVPIAFAQPDRVLDSVTSSMDHSPGFVDVVNLEVDCVAGTTASGPTYSPADFDDYVSLHSPPVAAAAGITDSAPNASRSIRYKDDCIDAITASLKTVLHQPGPDEPVDT